MRASRKVTYFTQLELVSFHVVSFTGGMQVQSKCVSTATAMQHPVRKYICFLPLDRSPVPNHMQNQLT